MPKETIGGMGFDVAISWGKDQDHVQVATTMPGEGDDTLAKLVARSNEYEKAEMRGLYATFTDRQSINMLIRTLRKARDGAFGADA